MCDLNGVPFFVNRAGLEMVGLDNIEQARRTPVRSFFFPEDQPRIMQEFFPSVLEKGHGEIEVRFRHFKTGEARWMAYKVLTLPDAAGRPIAFATVSQDVTERKRLEDNLRSLAADLSESGSPQERVPGDAGARAAEPARADQQRRASAAPGRQRRRRAFARRPRCWSVRSARWRGLVDDLLDMSRITRGKIELRKERDRARADRPSGRRSRRVRSTEA